MGKILKLGNLIFVTLFLTSIVLGGLFIMSSKSSAQTNPPTSGDLIQVQQIGCSANSAQTLKSCIDEVRQNGIPTIKITAPILCENRTDCQFDLSNLPNGVILQASELNKITRSGDYAYTLFTVNNTPNLKVTNLFIEDTDASPCPAGVDCPPTFTASSTSNLAFQNVTFQNSHGSALSITNSKDIRISGSYFIRSQENGVEIGSTPSGGKIIIENNRFLDNTGKGLLFQHQSDGSVIQGNRFVNNNARGTYTTEGGSCTFPCLASQLKITSPSSNLLIEKNTIIGGDNTVFSAVGLYSSGIELADRDMNSIRLSCNDISHNRGAAIVQDRPVRNISGIVIEKNKIWQNGVNINAPVSKIEDNNCFGESCALFECL